MIGVLPIRSSLFAVPFRAPPAFPSAKETHRAPIFVAYRPLAMSLIAADARAEGWAEASFATLSGPGNTHRLGVSLAAARLDRGFTDDLVIGIGGDSHPFSSIAGAACVLYGSTTTGLTTERTICFSASSGEIEAAGAAELFASALATGDLDDNAGRELVIGSPHSREVFVLKNALFADGFEIGGTSRWFDPND